MFGKQQNPPNPNILTMDSDGSLVGLPNGAGRFFCGKIFTQKIDLSRSQIWNFKHFDHRPLKIKLKETLSDPLVDSSNRIDFRFKTQNWLWSSSEALLSIES